MFLNSDKGFLHEVFNLCCKYNNISIWHGICPRKTNLQKLDPLRWIKKVVIDQNLSIDLEEARSIDSAYSCLFLNSFSPYKSDFKKYRTCKMFQKVGLFESADGRKRFIKAILTTNPFSEFCKFCKGYFSKLLQHQLTECQELKHQRRILELELNLFRNIEAEPIPITDISHVISSVIPKKCLLRCFTNFLQAIDF